MINQTPNLIKTGLGWRKITPAKDSEAAGSFSEVPIIDLRDMRHPDIERRRATAEQIYDACVRVGFFYIRNHGVPEEKVNRIFAEAKRFFHEVPLEEKMELATEKHEHFYGYYKIDLNPDQPGGAKLNEAINFGYEPSADPDATGNQNNGDNWWPSKDRLPGFQENVKEWMDLDETYLDSLGTRPYVISKMGHYPGELADPDTPSAIRAHTDYELFTILVQDENKSLEVVSKDGTWIPVNPIPGTFVVNIGDSMSILTNGLFVSTMHRVINKTKRNRYSVPFFFAANYDVLLEALPCCVSPQRPVQFKPVKSGDYIRTRLQGVYTKPDIEVNYDTIEVEPKSIVM